MGLSYYTVGVDGSYYPFGAGIIFLILGTLGTLGTYILSILGTYIC
jgi:hypothetical protein